jgi:lantibiotic biosynthesis protein
MRRHLRLPHTLGNLSVPQHYASLLPLNLPEQAASWLSLQEPEGAERYLDLAFDIAHRMSDPIVIEKAVTSARAATSEPEFIYWRPYGIAQGDAGIALMYGYFDACFPDQGWDHAAHQWIERASRGAEAEEWLPVGLFEGLSGLAFTADYLSRGGRRYRKLVEHLNDRVVNEAHAACDEFDKRLEAGSAPFSVWDAIAGITGIGTYFLSRRDYGNLLPIAERLIALSRHSEGLPCWRTPPEFSGEWMRHSYPEGHLNCGLAHGIPGPLALLSLARLDCFAASGLEEAIDRIASWLSDHCTNDAWGINWPSAVPLARCEGGLVKGSFEGLAGTHAGWCYGSPGVARALWLAGKARANEAFSSLALEAMRAVMRRPRHARALTSPALCHGVAGLLCTTLRFRQEATGEDFTGFGCALLGELEDMYEPETLLGFRTSEPGGGRIDQAGLLDGAPGIAMALLAASTAQPPIWDRLFLLS